MGLVNFRNDSDLHNDNDVYTGQRGLFRTLQDVTLPESWKYYDKLVSRILEELKKVEWRKSLTEQFFTFSLKIHRISFAWR